MSNFLATCISGVESLVRSELERQGIDITYGQDKLVGFEGDMMTLTKASIWSRVANRIYIEVGKAQIMTLESFFDFIAELDWKDWIPVGTPILVSATSRRSAVTHTPSIQSLGKKAIIQSLVGRDNEWNENMKNHPIEIFFLLVADELHILINTSGDALHKRGYRAEAGEAPIKESLASAMILFSGWKFATSFYDPMCGSGTIPIEAAMIAKNIAPGITREFDYQYFPWYPLEYHEKALTEARSKMYDKSYQIFGSDIDEGLIAIAKNNAHRAGVGDMITFTCEDIQNISFIDGAHCVTNPPYGKRLDSDDLPGLYDLLEGAFNSNHLTGGVITSVEYFPKNLSGWTKKNLMNGADKCQFWRRAC